MGHKRPKSDKRVQRDQMLGLRNKEVRKKRWEGNREKWASNEEYQDTQRKRKEVLQNKLGYMKNVQAGIDDSKARKIYKEKQKSTRMNKLIYAGRR